MDTSTYRIRKNGLIINKKWLDLQESFGLSEEEIAESLEISRRALWKIRKKMGWKQTVRSDKGRSRIEKK